MTDLFLQDKPKREQLLDWIKQKHYVKTHEVMEWGLKNYHIRADRDCRDLQTEGKIRRLTKEEVLMRWGNLKEGVWEIC